MEILDWAEGNAEKLVQKYLDAEPNEVFSQNELKNKGDYYIGTESSGDGETVFVDICFGDEFEKHDNNLEKNYEYFTRFAEDISDNMNYDVTVMTNSDDQTIMFQFTDWFPEESEEPEEYAKGGEVEKIYGERIITDKNGNQYAIKNWAAQGYIIPFDGSQYWEHFRVPKENWIKIEDINWSKFNISKSDFYNYLDSLNQKASEILNKYRSSFAKGGQVLDLKDVYNELRSKVGRLEINEESKDYIYCDIRDWGNWEHDYEDYERDEEDFEDDDSMILSESSAQSMKKIVEEIRTKYPTSSIKWNTTEKNYIDFKISRKQTMAEGGKLPNGKTINGYDVHYFKTGRWVYANIEIPSPNPIFDDDTQIKGVGKDEKEAFNDLKKEFEKYLDRKKMAKGGMTKGGFVTLYDENDKDKGYVIKKDDEYWVGTHWSSNKYNSEKYNTKKSAEENLKTIKYLTINHQDMFTNFDDGLTKKEVLEFINITKNINKKYWIKDSTGYSKYLYKGQLRNNDSVEGIFTATKIGADRLNDSYKYKIQVDELYPKELRDIPNLDANQNLKEKPISIANKDWKKYVKDNSSFSVDEETENKIVLATRENGSVGDEQHSPKDIERAKNILKNIKDKYPNTKGRIYTVDEWVMLELEAPKEMAKGGELEDDTFVMLFKGYGFVEKRGSYGSKTFYNKEHNAYIYYDPKYKSLSGYVGGGEGNDEVIPYSVEGVLDFFIEHDISESEATPLAKGGLLVQVGDKIKTKSGIQGVVYESTGQIFKLMDSLGVKSNTMHFAKDFKKGDIKTFGSGGMTAGRWYPDKTGEEFRYIGEDGTGKSLFNDGQKVVSKPLEDFETAPREKKLFKFFRMGGALKNDFLEDVAEMHDEIKEITLKDGSKITHDELMEAHQFLEPDETQEYYASMQYGKGGTFDSKVQSISKKLVGKPVPKQYRKEYGSRYDKDDAQEAARRIVGNMRKLYGE